MRTAILYFFLLFFLGGVYPSFSQSAPPSIHWQRSLGSSQTDDPGNIIRTTDGGFAIVGFVSEDDGDVSIVRNRDIWVVKLSNTGVILWERTFGGNGSDEGREIQNTADGGFVVIGTSMSNDTIMGGNHGYEDICVLKLDRFGNKQWYKQYGGSSHDHGISVQVVADGYVLLGSTFSNDGDISGNHGSYDIVVMKIDFAGNIIWKRCYGGSGEDGCGIRSFSRDHIKKTIDGGFIFTGESQSTDGDVSGYHSGPFVRDDIWVVKITGSGSIEWQHCFGGTMDEEGGDVIQTEDGGYLVTGNASSTDGDLPPSTKFDLWVFKLSSTGAMVWQKIYGGPQNDRGYKILPAADGGYIIAGVASEDGGDVSGIHVDRFSFDDCWLIKIDQTGMLKWQKPYGGTQPDEFVDMVYDSNGDLVLIGRTVSADYDVVPSHNPIPNLGSVSDIWVVKMGGFNTIKGNVFLDLNDNGVKDPNETAFPEVIVKSEKPGYSYQSALKNGQFNNRVDTGTFITSVTTLLPYYHVTPASKTSSFQSFLNTDSLDFAVRPIPGKRDYRVDLFPESIARLNSILSYKIKITNVGTDTLINSILRLRKDSRLIFLSSNLPPLSISADTIRWTPPTVLPNDSAFIVIQFKVPIPPQANLGDTLISFVQIDTTGDLNHLNNSSLLRQRIIAAFDPNEKQESGGGFLYKEDYLAGKELNYIIRFQNTGNDTAFNITIRDTLDGKLIWETLEMVASSHSYQLSITNGNQLQWNFANVLLPDNNSNEPASHGYIVYRIKPKSNLVVGDTIKNSASIYFDFNPAVKTNTHETVIKSAPPVPSPVVIGVLSDYCKNLGVQQGKIANLPSLNSGILALASLNGTSLPIAADSTFSFNVGTMPVGISVLQVVFASLYDADTLIMQIRVSATATPDVNVSANITNITSLANPVVLTATNAIGGGSSPLYTFALDRTFTTILQAEGNSNTLTLNPSNLLVGDNWIYVRMKTSLTCYTNQTNIDSILLKRDAVTGLIDLDDPARIISVYPNPFSRQITIKGLNPVKNYEITIIGVDGKQILKRQIQNTSQFNLPLRSYSAGIYFLNLYDKNQQRLIGTVRMVRE